MRGFSGPWFNSRALTPIVDKYVDRLKGLTDHFAGGFKKESFDFIYCNDVLEHCKNPQQLLRESYRVLPRWNYNAATTILKLFGISLVILRSC